MTSPRLIPAKTQRKEITVGNSRFIASLAHVSDVDTARDFITSIKAEFSDASHNVPAFIIGHGQSITEHCQDDGEPGGTAGRPMLAVLRGSGLGDVAVVVTRYFGGTKLGKGGLVRAYGDAVKAVLEGLPVAQKVATCTVMVAVHYSLFEQTRLLAAEFRGAVLNENFAADATLTIRLRQADTPAFRDAISELTSGSTRGEIISEDKDTIMPINS